MEAFFLLLRLLFLPYRPFPLPSVHTLLRPSFLFFTTFFCFFVFLFFLASIPVLAVSFLFFIIKFGSEVRRYSLHVLCRHVSVELGWHTIGIHHGYRKRTQRTDTQGEKGSSSSSMHQI